MFYNKGMTTARRREGFTLIELLVVVLIIGILASIATPQYFKVVETARIAEANSMMASIRGAQEVSLARSGRYVDSNAGMSAFDIELPGQDPTYGMKYFFVVVGPGSPIGCPDDADTFNIAFIRYGRKAKVMKRYYKNYMMVYERCGNSISFPGCPNCEADFKR